MLHLPVIISNPLTLIARFPPKPVNYGLLCSESQEESMLMIRVAFPTKRLTLTQHKWNTISEHFCKHTWVSSPRKPPNASLSRASGIMLSIWKQMPPQPFLEKFTHSWLKSRMSWRNSCWNTLRRGTFIHLRVPMLLLSSLSRKRMENFDLSQDYQQLNQWTIWNTYPLPLIPQLINKQKPEHCLLNSTYVGDITMFGFDEEMNGKQHLSLMKASSNQQLCFSVLWIPQPPSKWWWMLSSKRNSAKDCLLSI